MYQINMISEEIRNEIEMKRLQQKLVNAEALRPKPVKQSVGLTNDDGKTTDSIYRQNMFEATGEIGHHQSADDGRLRADEDRMAPRYNDDDGTKTKWEKEDDDAVTTASRLHSKDGEHVDPADTDDNNRDDDDGGSTMEVEQRVDIDGGIAGEK